MPASPWDSPAAVAQLRKLGKTMTNAQIAKHLGEPLSTIYKALQRNHIKTLSAPGSRGRPAYYEQITQLAPTHTAAEMARLLQLEEKTVRHVLSRLQIKAKAAINGMAKRPPAANLGSPLRPMPSEGINARRTYQHIGYQADPKSPMHGLYDPSRCYDGSRISL